MRWQTGGGEGEGVDARHLLRIRVRMDDLFSARVLSQSQHHDISKGAEVHVKSTAVHMYKHL